MKEFFHYCSLIIVELLGQSQKKKDSIQYIDETIQKIQLILRSSYMIAEKLLV